MTEDDKDSSLNLYGLSTRTELLNQELEHFIYFLQMVAVMSDEDGDEETLDMTEQCMSKLTDAHARIKELGSIVDNMVRTGAIYND